MRIAMPTDSSPYGSKKRPGTATTYSRLVGLGLLDRGYNVGS